MEGCPYSDMSVSVFTMNRRPLGLLSVSVPRTLDSPGSSRLTWQPNSLTVACFTSLVAFNMWTVNHSDEGPVNSYTAKVPNRSRLCWSVVTPRALLITPYCLSRLLSLFAFSDNAFSVLSESGLILGVFKNAACPSPSAPEPLPTPCIPPRSDGRDQPSDCSYRRPWEQQETPPVHRQSLG